jgi:type I restriction enzyme S subunit
MTASNQVTEASVKYLAEVAEQVVPIGYKQTEVGVIPEDWGVIQITDVCDFIVPGRNKPVFFDGSIPWITTPDFQDGGSVSSSRLGLYISREEAKKIGSRVVPAGSVIMSCVGDLGITGIANQEIVINQQLHAFIPSGKINAHFLLHVLKTKKDYFYSIATKTALPYLNKENCNSVKLPAPHIAEQTTIANALSDVDALINELEKLIAKKQAIKTATMQQLLTGRTRLPQFALREDGTLKDYKQSELGEIPEDWEAITINEALADKFLLDQMDGNHGELYPKSHEFSSFGVPYIGATDFDSGRINYKTCKYLPLARAEKFKKGIAKDGDVLFAHNATVGPVVLLQTELEFVILSTTATYYRCDPERLNNKYLAKFFESEFFVKQYSAVMSQSTRNQVPILSQRKFSIVLPSIKEQIAIATILSDMDTDIQTLQQRLSKTRQIKQGMMQELLTGKTRLV